MASPLGKMHNIYNALIVKGQDIVGKEINVTCKVQQLLGNNREVNNFFLKKWSAKNRVEFGSHLYLRNVLAPHNTYLEKWWSNFKS